MTALIEIKDLRVTARAANGAETEIVKGVSFSVKRGEVMGLIGESGSGKTTIALATMGYTRFGCHISGGSVRIGETDITALDAKGLMALRGRRIAYIAQSAAASFNPSRTIMAQVIESALIHGTATETAAKTKAVELFRALAIPEPETIGARYPHQVSGGQLQRLMAAMALITDPEVVIFDEPTTALDVTTQIEVLKAFKTAIHDRATTGIYVTHDLAVIAQIADSITVLRHGEVRETSETEALIHRPLDEYSKSLLAAAEPALRLPKETLATAAPLLEVSGLLAGYGSMGPDGLPAIPILRDIDLAIAPGRSLGVIGESGCGKSTLARVIAGLTPLARGTVKLKGEALPPVLAQRTKDQLRRIQIVFQMADTALNPRVSVEDILGRPLTFYFGLTGEARAKRVRELLDLTHLPASVMQRRPGDLSGGQKQRVNLARALAAKPDVLLCDEVTSALDTVVAAAILDLMAELRRDLGLTTMFISHDLKTVRAICDDVMVLYAGRMAEKIPASAIIAPHHHPYTQLLFASVPELRRGWLEDSTAVSEAKVDIVAMQASTGCAFFLRCPQRIPGTCDHIPPPVRQASAEALIACHRETCELSSDAASPQTTGNTGMPLIVGVDIGGTFADFVAVDTRTGEIETLKVLTTPTIPGEDIAAGLKRLAEGGLVLGEIERFVHGTTVGVNTIIQRRGARVALFTTAGFTDILELARLRMPNPYSLFCERPAPLVPREHVFPIAERMAATGETLLAPTEADVSAAVAKALAVGAEVIVVSFLHAWRAPRHERAVAAMIAKIAPEITVFCGAEVWPVIREYERTTTAVLNAYVQPRIDNYLRRVSGELGKAGVTAPLLLTTSIGGTMTAKAGRRDCVGMLLSGTASGVVGASLVAKAAGLRSVLTLDIGGTSADVALLENGEPSFATGLSIGEFPLATTTVAVQSSGQGGGSIVWLDEQGVLQVGPVSAGSTPGPACFDRGGTAMTVTDAALITGILGHGVIGFGAITPRPELAAEAAKPIAEKLGIGVPELAEGVLRVAVSGMLIAIEQLLARAGVHASELTLMPFGGAGPMLGTLLAEAAGVQRILVPATPGTLCALGAASAAIRRDTMRTVLLPLAGENLGKIAQTLDDLAAEAETAIVGMVGAGQSAITRSADLRYKGQSFEITVPVDDLATPDALVATFHEAYERAFGHSDRETPVHVVNLRVSSARPAPDIRLSHAKGAPHEARASGTTQLYSGGAWREARLYDRKTLTPGATMIGPAIVIQDDTTLLMTEGWRAEVDGFRNIRMEQV